MRSYLILLSQDIGKQLLESPAVSALVALALWLFSTFYGTGEVTGAGMTLLVLLVIADWISGSGAARKDGIDTSNYGVMGVRRTVLLLMLPAIANFLDTFLYTMGFITYFVIGALARSITKSIIANTIRAGWSQWIPVDLLEKLAEWVSSEIAHKEARAQQRQDEIYKKKEEGNNGSN